MLPKTLIERWREEEGFGTPPPEGQKAFDPHQPRDPHTGEWVSTPGSGDLAQFDLVAQEAARARQEAADREAQAPSTSPSDQRLIQDAIDEADSSRTSQDIDPHPGRKVPDELSIDAETGLGKLPVGVSAGASLWDDYLSPSGYDYIQEVARGQKHDDFKESELGSFENGLLPKYGKSRKGKETWRVTTLDHMSAANKKKLKEGKPVTVKEPGLLSLGVERQSTEYVGEQTHPESRSRVELRIKVATDQKAMDSLQKSGAGTTILPEYVYPRGMKLYFTGKSHIERRPFFDFTYGGDPADTEAWKVRNVKVYEVELRGP